MIVLCGNPREYNKQARTFDAAVMDRLRTLNIEWDSASFIQYAQKSGFHPRVLNYLELNPDSCYRIDDSSLVTCRGWENLSNQLRMYEDMGEPIDYKMIHQFIKSDAIATGFFNYYIESLNINKSEINSIIENEMDEELIEKYSSADASVRLNLVQILQKKVIEETAVPYKKSVSLDQLRTLFKSVKDKGVITHNFRSTGYMTPLDVLNHIVNNNGDTTGLMAARPTGPFFGNQMLQLDIPDIWSDREAVGELRELLAEMCSEEEMKGGRLRSPEDVSKEADRQAERLKRFLNVKSSDLKKSWNRITKHIDNIFRFLEQLEGGEVYTERFFYFIGHSPALLRTVTEGNSKEYYKRLDDIYGGNCA